MITMIKTFKDTPLSEIILRKYEKPAISDNRELIKKFMLSIGLLQPGDSRDIIVDIFHVLVKNSINEKELSSQEINEIVITERNQQKLALKGIAPSNIRRQLKRLRDIMLIEKKANKYRVSEFMNISEIFEHKLESYFIRNIMNRVKDYTKEIDKRFFVN